MRARASAGARSVAGTFVTLALAYGVWYAYSVFLVALLREFGWSRSLVAGAFSAFTLVHGALGVPIGWLADRAGPRRIALAGGLVLGAALVLDGAVQRPWHLYVAFGFLTALGVGLAGWVPAVVLVRRWYPDRIGTAMGITSAGVGAGIFLVVPACQWLIDHYGWRWAFRVMGLGTVAWVIPSAIFLVRNPPPPPVPAPTAAPAAPPAAAGDGRAGDLTLGGALRSLPFWLLAATLACTSFANQLLLVHQVAFLVDHGIPAIVGASVVGLIGIASIVSKIGGGWASDFVGRRTTYAVGTACVAASVGALGLLAGSPGPGLAYLYGALIGIGYAMPAAVTPALLSDAFRTRHFGAIFGTMHVASAVGGSLGPWVGGRVFDATGSYGPALVAAVVVLGVGLGALWATRR